MTIEPTVLEPNRAISLQNRRDHGAMHLHPRRAIGPAVIEKEQITSLLSSGPHTPKQHRTTTGQKKTAPGPIQGRLLKKRIH